MFSTPVRMVLDTLGAAYRKALSLHQPIPRLPGPVVTLRYTSLEPDCPVVIYLDGERIGVWARQASGRVRTGLWGRGPHSVRALRTPQEVCNWVREYWPVITARDYRDW